MSKTIITIETIVNKPVDKVWEMWTKPEHITKWYFASDDWHAPSSTSDFKIGGKLNIRMEGLEPASTVKRYQYQVAGFSPVAST